MKKLLLFTVVAWFLTSCSNEEGLLVQDIGTEATESLTLSNLRTVDEAAQIAYDAIGMLPGSNGRTAGRSFDKNKVKIAKSLGSRASGTDTLMYVFNFDDEQGFAAVAANRAVKEGLIAVTELGSYDPEVTPENPGLAMYMDAAKDYLDSRSTSVSTLAIDSTNIFNPTDPIMSYKIVRDTIYAAVVTPNYNMNWGQLVPEGLLCSNKTAGCTNLSCMMAMAYLEYPTQMQLTYDGSNNEVINIDWQAIKGHHLSDSVAIPATDLCTNDTHTKMSQICRELGLRNHSIYIDATDDYPAITVTNHDYIESTLDNLGLHPAALQSGFPSDSSIASGLQAGGIILVSGFFNNTLGHMFVLDGIKYHDIHTSEWTRESGKPWVLSNDHGTTAYHYNHFNWGWYGDGNGYFYSGVFDVNKPNKYDDNTKPGTGSFSSPFSYIVVYK